MDVSSIMLMRVGATRTLWVNIIELSNMFNIPIDVMVERVRTHINPHATMTGNNELLIKGVHRHNKFLELFNPQ